MKVRYTAPNDRLEFEFDCTTGKQAFETVSRIQELFEESECGCCNGKNLHLTVREHDGNKFYGVRCECGAQLDFGQRKDGSGMWAKRQTKDGDPMPNKGWYIYQRGISTPAPREQQPARGEDPDNIPF